MELRGGEAADRMSVSSLLSVLRQAGIMGGFTQPLCSARPEFTRLELYVHLDLFDVQRDRKPHVTPELLCTAIAREQHV